MTTSLREEAPGSALDAGVTGPESAARATRWRRPSLWTLVAALFVAIGTGLRIDAFLRRPSFWLDELSVALNLVDRDLRGLTRPLELNQAAPVGWLWGERASLKFFGTSEAALRFPSLVAGILLLLVTAVLARQLLPLAYAWVPVSVVALCPRLIEYSTELKPYSSDALLVAVVLSCSVLVLRRERTRHLLLWALVAGVAVAVSLPAILATAATGLVILAAFAARAWRRRERSTLLSLLGAGAAQLPWFLMALWERAHLDPATVDGGGFWRPGYPASVVNTLGWLPGAGGRLASYLAIRPSWLLLPLVAVALVALFRVSSERATGWLGALAVVAVLATAVAAAAVHTYPLMQRAALFLVAPAAVAVAALPALAGSRSRRRLFLGQGIAAAVVLALALMWVDTSPAIPVIPGGAPKAPAAPPLELVRAHLQPGDVVVVHAWVPRAYRWYGGQIGLPQGFVMVPAGGPCSPRQAGTQLAPARRMWAVAIDQPESSGLLSQKAFFSAASAIGVEQASYPFGSGAHVVLYQLKPPADLPSVQSGAACPLMVSQTPEPVLPQPAFWH
jgi:hypothetical protein